MFSVSQPANCSIINSVLEQRFENGYSAVIKPNQNYLITCHIKDIDRVRSISYSFNTNQSFLSVLFSYIKYVVLFCLLMVCGGLLYYHRDTIKYSIYNRFVNDRDITEQITHTMADTSLDGKEVEAGLLKTTISDSGTKIVEPEVSLKEWRCVSCRIELKD